MLLAVLCCAGVSVGGWLVLRICNGWFERQQQPSGGRVQTFNFQLLDDPVSEYRFVRDPLDTAPSVVVPPPPSIPVR